MSSGTFPSVTVATDGTCSTSIQVPPGKTWQITLITISSDSNSNGKAYVYVNSVLSLVSFNPIEDYASGSPISAPPGSTITISCIGLSAGSTFTASLEYS